MVKDALHYESLRDDYLFCRTFLHAWNPTIADHLEKPETDTYRISLQCTRCTTFRHDIVDSFSGDLVRRRYEHPDDYQIGEKVTRSQLRTEINRRDYDFLGISRKKRAKK